jgi:hypothetical protein
MATSEERIQVLNLIASGKITAEEGSKLLRALEEGSHPRETDAPTRPRLFRVRVTDLASGKAKVNVSIPMGLVNVGVRMGARFAPGIEGFNYEEIVTAIRQGAYGRIADITDENAGERVEIYVE